MQDSDAIWAEAAAGVQADVDADVRAEAFEVYMAEAARMRIHDRRGPARLTLRCGAVLIGDLAGDGPGSIAGMIEMREASGRRLLVGEAAIMTLTGTAAVLHDEAVRRLRPTLSARLRETWQLGGLVRVLLADGRWVAGDIVQVGADHVELAEGGESVVIPFGAVEAWSLP